VPLVRSAATKVGAVTGIPFAEDFQHNQQFSQALLAYSIYKLRRWPFFPGGLQLPGDKGVAISREWAFQRHEELRLAIGTPVLRGPVAALSIAPRSRRSQTETESLTTVDVQTARTSQLRRSIESEIHLASSRFQQALNNLSEYGIADANSFAHESTLRTALSEERRATVEMVAREISREVETGRRVTTTANLGRATEYNTEGKDPKLATTELGFDVVTPLTATVLLRDLALVWCPRVNSPFLNLHTVVHTYEEQQRRAYVSQHFVPLPVKPVLKVEVREEKFEVQIDGVRSINTKSFTRTFQFTNPNSFIDLDLITAEHRNGGWNDFDWNERPNWDDLEHAVARVQDLSLSPDGRTLSGTAVLETNDPELLNRSFIRITVPIKTYTEETIAAVAAYEQAL
jgi:hypothetical protein